MKSISYIHITPNSGRDIWDTQCQAILIPCSADGKIVAKSLMAQCAGRYKAWYRLYQEACATGQLQAGQCMPCFDNNGILRILFIAIKERLEDKPELLYLERALAHLQKHLPTVSLISLACTKIGCGNGPMCLQWGQVGPMLAGFFSQAQVRGEIWISGKDPEFYPIEEPDIVYA